MASPVSKINPTDQSLDYGGDSAIMVEFYEGSVLLGYKTEKEKRPCYESKPFVRMHFAGDRLKRIDRPVTDIDKIRFRAQWELFEQGRQNINEGTPLRHMPWLNEADVQNFAGLKIYTVEQLASINDSVLSTLAGGMRSLVNNARDWLANQQDHIVTTELRQENEKLKDEMQMMKEQLKILMSAQDTKAKKSA